LSRSFSHAGLCPLCVFLLFLCYSPASAPSECLKRPSEYFIHSPQRPPPRLLTRLQRAPDTFLARLDSSSPFL
jgi:hypothetical protein